ncbi:unnamed protein product [Protopolystoma xenopodis]|uniref:Deacetylase sirtuin-type domain-containing protein n=1 Tax=Protopolystoma xenopodis TaxID=117903 RepID=A0A3S5CLK5_9PLAT|nr:unnamed protein product [Protopolystoma xenopodis]
MLQFVPNSRSVRPGEVSALVDFIRYSKALAVITGAGISTESGLPDYRSENVGLYARLKHKPIQFQDFLNNENIRKRFWARSYAGWPKFSTAKPNISHNLLSEWMKRGRILHIITQNVDRLHFRSGASRVLELHGTLFLVICLSCGKTIERSEIQLALKDLNQDAVDYIAGNVHESPDGDVAIPDDLVLGFNVPSCPACKSGILKPDVVFFGENVPSVRSDEASQIVANADSILCLGTSLQVCVHICSSILSITYYS